MTPEFCYQLVKTACGVLPPHLSATNQSARVLVAIALQESKLKWRRQLGGGPALNLWQFEVVGVRGVVTHSSSAKLLQDAMNQLCYNMTLTPSSAGYIHRSSEHNDLLAAVLARLLLWTVPRPLPTEEAEGWRQYLEAWNPGKPHPETWAENWSTAMALPP